MKALLYKDLYYLKRNLLANLFVMVLAPLYFYIDIYKNGINMQNFITPSLLIQMLTLMMLGGIISIDKTGRIANYLKATPLRKDEYFREKLILQCILFVVVVSLESLVAFDFEIVKMIIVMGSINYIVGLFYMYMMSKDNTAFSMVPLIIAAVIFFLSMKFPEFLAYLFYSELTGKVLPVILILDIVASFVFLRVTRGGLLDE